MRVLVINTGSSSIKYQLIQMPEGERVCVGLIERIGEENGRISHTNSLSGHTHVEEHPIENHEEGMRKVADLLTHANYGVIDHVEDIRLVGHRVVLGGEKFSSTSVITDEVKQAIDELSIIAPLHNPPNLAGIKVAEQVFPHATQVGVFDTSFHHSIPEYAYRYALPERFYKEHGIRAYGYHGTSHQYVSHKAADFLGLPEDEFNGITIHLGNGASITAIKNGKSIDTSLGMTPISGLIMGTRIGDIDPGILIYLNESLGYSVKEIKTVFNKDSGLKGFTGHNDMRLIEEAYANGDSRAKLALNAYVYRIKKYIGSYLAILGSIDAIVFTAGIGENSTLVREKVTQGLNHFGIEIDPEQNHKRSKKSRDISSAKAAIKTLVIPTNEELEIARQAYRIISD
jgi:acetate kinase